MEDMKENGYNEDFNISNVLLCESKKENKLLIMLDDTQNCNTPITGLPFQEVFIDLSECKITNSENEKEINRKNFKET